MLHSRVVLTKDFTRCINLFQHNNDIQYLHSSGVRKIPDVCLWSIANPEVIVVRVDATDSPGNASRDKGKYATGDASRDVLGADSDDEYPISRRSMAKCRGVAYRGVVDLTATVRGYAAVV